MLRWAYTIVAKTGRYDLACQEWRQYDPAKKDWEKIKLHFKAADRDMRSQDTTGTAGYHGANAATSDATLLATTQAALVAIEIQLAQASRKPLSPPPPPPVDQITRRPPPLLESLLSQPRTHIPVPTAEHTETLQTWTTRAPRTSIQTMNTKLLQPR
jgi:hypothetical protein